MIAGRILTLQYVASEQPWLTSEHETPVKDYRVLESRKG